MLKTQLHQPSGDAADYVRIASAISFLIDRREDQPSLDEVAGHLGLSPFHAQRLFTRWAGVSPKKFLAYVTVEHAKRQLEASASVFDAALDAGLSGPSRLHDLMIVTEAMTPGEYKSQGADMIIRYGVHETPYGTALVLVRDRGLCGLDFLENGHVEQALASARTRWPLSAFKSDQTATAVIEHVFGKDLQPKLLLRGTPFQIQVWRALLSVPAGAIVSYGGLAKAIGKPSGARAVGTALAANPIGYAVPCHRVLRATGLFERYRWGAPRRWAMLAREAAAQEAADAAA